MKYFSTIPLLKEANRKLGQHWFSKDTMKFFNTQIESIIYDGNYFITSEKFNDEHPRKYTVRSFNADGRVFTIGKFQQFSTLEEAVEEIKRLQRYYKENI